MGDHWKSLADKLGAPGMDDPTPTEASPVSESQESENTAVTQAEHRPEPKAAEPKAAEPAQKSKKKSSWEALASIFNIRTETPADTVDEPKVEHDSEVRTSESFTVAFKSEPKPAPKENRLHVFPESFDDSREKPANSALEAMFADAPRGDLDSWKKSPRVVDDLGWDDEPPKSRETEEMNIAPVPLSDSESDLDEPAAAEGEERRPRRRRRRRGPRRPASDVTADPNSLDAGEVLSVESGDEWTEPESFEVGTEDEGSEVAEVVDPERRSSRRRRRGRKRPTEDSAAEPRTEAERRPSERAERPAPVDRAERVANRDSEERPNRRPERRTEGERADRERSEPRERAERGERSGRGEPRERGERTERAERPERERPERQPRVHQERPLPPRADADESDDADELDDSENSAIKHRNIPTWEDSLQSIIEANIANHNRNENRGGGGQSRGGRPRGRGR